MSPADHNAVEQRPSSRLLVLNDAKCVLLFKFEHKSGPLAGQAFWATPGGGLEDGESFQAAARRELMEEVGLRRDDVGPQIAQRTATFRAPSGALVEADERYFIVHSDNDNVATANWTELELEVMTAHRWWSQADLRSAAEQVWPEDLEDMLVDAGEWTAVL